MRQGKTKTHLKRAVVAWTAVSVLSGCTTLARDFQEPSPVGSLPSQSTPQTMEPPSEDAGSAISSIQVDPTSFLVRPVRPQDNNLPNFQIRNLAATESGLQDALQMMLEGTGLTLSVSGGARGMERYGATAVQGIKGSLREVLDDLSDQIGFFWSASRGTIKIEPDRLFVVELPPVLSEDSLATMSNTMQYLGARDTYLDRMARTFIFRADRRSLDNIDAYLEGIRATRSMLVYEVQIYQVDLTDANQQGIKWNKLSTSSLDRSKKVADQVSDTVSDLANSFGLTTSGTSLGAVVMGPKFNLDVLIDFLKTQGTVKTVSQPRLAILNNSKGSFRVGETLTYVSKVGSNLASGVSQVTVETKDLRTGLELGVTGEEHDSTITTRISLALSELIRMRPYTTLGTDLSLPNVTDRDLHTVLRLPPGYTALLGGITTTREADDRTTGIRDNAKTTEVKRSELVMVLKTSVVRFKTKDKHQAGMSSHATSSPVNKAADATTSAAVASSQTR